MQKPFDLGLIHTVLSTMIPMVRVDEHLIWLSAVERAVAHPDGTLTLFFMSGGDITLTATQGATLAETMKRGIEMARQQAARQAAQQMGIITH